MIYIFGSILIIYSLLIFWLFIGYLKVSTATKKTNDFYNSFSIIVPFRNEADNLPKLLHSIEKLHYPKNRFEIIFVDDASTDNGKEIIEKFNKLNLEIQLTILANIRQSKSPKKDAIEHAINAAKYDWIITTDADCSVPKSWLNIFDSTVKERNPVLMAGGIYIKPRNFLQIVELFDLISLLVSTIGSFGNRKPMMCNGANLCYKKSVFYDVSGFNGNNHLATGDDFFLLQKIQLKYSTQVTYIKSNEHLVETNGNLSLKQLIEQRIRWGSKTTMANNFTKLIGFIILLSNLIFIIFLLISLLLDVSWYYFTTFLLLKSIIDLLLIFPGLLLSRQCKFLLFYPFISFIHPFLLTIFSFGSIFKRNYTWKDRSHIS
ncbi:glycosyltransferase [Urechidicola sp. KH5]